MGVVIENHLIITWLCAIANFKKIWSSVMQRKIEFLLCVLLPGLCTSSFTVLYCIIKSIIIKGVLGKNVLECIKDFNM